MAGSETVPTDHHLSKDASAMARRWSDEIMPFLAQGDIGFGLVLAVLIQMTRAVLDDMPPEVRENTIKAIATPGVAVTPAVEDARQ